MSWVERHPLVQIGPKLLLHTVSDLVTTFNAWEFSREEHCIFKWESVQSFFLLQHVSISSSFSTYGITIYNKAFMSSWHAALFCHQVLKYFWTAELRTSEKASTKSCSELAHIFLISLSICSCHCVLWSWLGVLSQCGASWLPHCSLWWEICLVQ